MAQERGDVNNFDRVDPADSTLADREDRRMADNDVDLEIGDSMALDSATDGDDLGLASATDDDTPEEAEQIKVQIEETRNQMGETIDAIQDRLSFTNISEQVSEHVSNAVETAKEAVYDATIGKAAGLMKNLTQEISGSSIVRTAKNNPYPFVLIGAGIGLLAYQTLSGRSSSSTERRQLSDTNDRALGSGSVSRSSTIGGARESISGVTDTVSNAAGNAYQKATDVVGSAYTGAGDAVSKAYDRVGELGATARDQYNYHLEENPLALGGVALALGTAVGMAIPATVYESRLMGEAREELMDKAQTTASELLDKTKQVVTEAGRTITEQAKSTMEH